MPEGRILLDNDWTFALDDYYHIDVRRVSSGGRMFGDNYNRGPHYPVSNG